MRLRNNLETGGNVGKICYFTSHMLNILISNIMSKLDRKPQKPRVRQKVHTVRLASMSKQSPASNQALDCLLAVTWGTSICFVLVSGPGNVERHI